MRLARGAARVAILVAVVLLVQFIVLPASATSYDLNGSAECVALGGVWSIGCTFSSLTVASGDTLTIATLVAVEITGSLVVDGTLDNLGGILIDNTATVTINGAFENEEVFETYGSVTVNTGGSFYNVGSSPGFTNEAGAYFNILGNLENGPPGTMNNDGAMVIGTSGEIANYGTISSLYGSLTTYGELYNDATFYNGGWLNAAFSGSIYNDVSGTLDNLIVINVTSTLYNLGALDSLASSVINVGSGATAGYLGNDGSIQNAGSYVITANGELDNYEDLDNTGGTIANVGLVLNECTATVENAAGVSPDPVQYVPCAPEILGYSTTTSSTGLPSTAYTVFGLSNLYSGGGNPLLIKLYEDGATLLGSNLTSDAAGSWSITTPPLAAGDDVVYATATDAQDIVSLPSSPFTIAVIVDTSIGVACSPTSLDVGTPTTCTATVTELGGGPPTTPTGTVDWSDPGGTFSSTTCALSPNGVTAEAACTTSYVPGSGSEGSPIYVTGDFTGSTYYYGSTSDAAISSTKLGSTTGLTCVPLVLDAPSTCTATVTDAPPSANIFPGSVVTWTTTGSGSFSSGGVCTLAEVNPSASTCSLTYTPTAKGAVSITASYGGDIDHTGSSHSESFSVSKRSVSVAMVCTPTSVPVKVTISCTVTVKDTSPGVPLTPKGTITVTHGTTTVGTCVLSGSGGIATCKVSFTLKAAGTYSLVAGYPGDADHLSMKSSAIAVKVT